MEIAIKLCILLFFFSTSAFSQNCSVSNCNECQYHNANSCLLCSNSSIKTINANGANFYCVTDSSISYPTVMVISFVCFALFMTCGYVIYRIVVKIKEKKQLEETSPRGQISKRDNMLFTDFNQMDSSINWKIGVKAQQNLTDSCCICLDCGIDTTTLCGHHYHGKCFADWLKKKGTCPLCQTEAFNPVRLYCVDCHKKYLEIDVRLYQRIVQKKGKTCDKCIAK